MIFVNNIVLDNRDQQWPEYYQDGYENQPPCLTSKSYERYKLELLAWREVTDISRFKQGIIIALSLPEDDKNQIKEKVFTQISLDDLKKGWIG